TRRARDHTGEPVPVQRPNRRRRAGRGARRGHRYLRVLMPGLDDLYREIILDHYRTPRNRGDLPVPPARHAEGHNPLCGDEVTVYVQVDDVDGVATVSDVKVTGQGCSISQSSASMMSQAIKGKPVGEAE